MELKGTSPYELQIMTRGKIQSGTRVPLYIKISGTKSETKMNIMSEIGFNKGSNEKVSLLTKDVGDICAIKIEMTQNDIWEPENISIKKVGGAKKEWKDIK